MHVTEVDEYRANVEVAESGHTKIELRVVRGAGFKQANLTGVLDFDTQEVAFKFLSGMIEGIFQGEDPHDYSGGRKEFIRELTIALRDDPHPLSNQECCQRVISFLEDHHELRKSTSVDSKLQLLGFRNSLDEFKALLAEDRNEGKTNDG